MDKGGRAEGKPNQPARSQEEEAFLALLRTADRLQTRLANMLKPQGLSPTQYNALRILRGAGAEGLACREVGERMIKRDPDITRLLDRMAQRGLVSRGRERKDRRVIRARITASGLERLKAIDRDLGTFHRELLGHLGPQRLESLIRLLDAVRGDLWSAPRIRGR